MTLTKSRYDDSIDTLVESFWDKAEQRGAAITKTQLQSLRNYAGDGADTICKLINHQIERDFGKRKADEKKFWESLKVFIKDELDPFAAQVEASAGLGDRDACFVLFIQRLGITYTYRDKVCP